MAKAIFGIELEIPLKIGVSTNDFRNCLSEAIGHELVHFTERNRTVGYHSTEYEQNVDKWRVASDSSLNDFEGRGVEIVSRRRTTLEETKKAMESTRHLVDLELMSRTRSGGHHVHIGILHFSAIKRTYRPEKRDNCTRGYRDGPCDSIRCSDCQHIIKLVRTKRVKELEIRIHEIYDYFQPVLNSIVSRSRRTTSSMRYNRGVSSYYLEAKNNPTSEIGRAKNQYLNNRERAAPFRGNRGVVNFGKLSSYGTVEYRQHQQTYHVSTVQNWVKLMHRLTSRSWVQESKNIDPRNYPITVDGMCDFLGLGQNRLRAWMRRRANHFTFHPIAERQGRATPTIGIRTRTHSLENAVNELSPELRRALQGENTPFNPEENNRLYDAIVLACANHEETYDLVRFHNERNLLDTEILKEICRNIPESFLPENYQLTTWNNLNWDNIRMEVIEGLVE